MNEDLIYSNGFGKHSIYHSKQKKKFFKYLCNLEFHGDKNTLAIFEQRPNKFWWHKCCKKKKYVQCTTMFIQVKSSDL